MHAYSLASPWHLLDAVERCWGIHADSSLEPFNSYVNRVYGIGDDKNRFILKCYRPDRWTKAGLEDEHRFIADCKSLDLPVALPLAGLDGSTVQTLQLEDGTQMHLGLFPRMAGRQFDAERDEDWLRLGSLAGRMHAAGRRGLHTARNICHPLEQTARQLETLWTREIVHTDLENDFFDLAEETLARLAPLFDTIPNLRIHGDFHRGNILDRGPEGLLAIDFDDTMTGPAVQDLWLLLPGRAHECRRELELILEGYVPFSSIDSQELELIEGLRFMRQIHYLAWLAHQSDDPAFLERHPDWASKAYWIRELEDLRTQADFVDN